MQTAPDILVVDDEVDIGNLLVDVLSDEGYLVRYAADGSQAITMVGQRAPALILLDYTMPRMSGAEVLAALRTSGFARPIIVMSASTRAEALRHAGATDILAKPFDLEHVLDCIRRYVP